jgi:apolipoprotein D and lipocalin family protein
MRRALTGCIAWICLAVSTAAAAPPEPVAGPVDLARYAGRWYEIRKIPNRFQDQCARGTTATYRLRDDGRIDVVNRCLTADGETEEAGGIARIVDRERRSRLQVSFVSFFGWRPFWGDYWILGLDPDYSWAVVGTPSRDYGWVLSREPSLTPAQADSVTAILRRQGYDTEAFATSPQDVGGRGR